MSVTVSARLCRNFAADLLFTDDDLEACAGGWDKERAYIMAVAEADSIDVWNTLVKVSSH
jgi:hypothetical protein